MEKYPIFIEILLKVTGYSLFGMAILFLFKDTLAPIYQEVLKDLKHYSKLRLKNLKDNQIDLQWKLLKNIDLLLRSTTNLRSSVNSLIYLIVSVGVFLISLIVYYKYTHSLLSALLGAILTAFMPFIFLWTRLMLIRTETSYDLVPGTSIILTQYRIKHNDIYYALLETSKELDKGHLRTAFLKLVSNIQGYERKSQLERAIEIFVFTVGTTWAKQLGIIIQNAISEGANIEEALMNLVEDMTKAQQIIEAEKSENSDSVKLGFLPIVIYPLTIYYLGKISGLNKVLYYQFQTERGLSSFILTLFFCTISFIVALFLRKPKNEV